MSESGSGQPITSLADISPEKKISVLKKAIVSLTKQKQDIESQRVALEAKVVSLVNELRIRENTLTECRSQNKELQRQLDAVSSRFSIAGSASAVAMKAGNFLSVLSSPKEDRSNAVSSSVSGGENMSKEDQQRLFEENESLHIQLFEVKQMCDKKIKAAVAERSEMALRLHTLEGLVASFQASDAEQSHHAQETSRLLAIERNFTAMCEVLLFEGNKLEGELGPIDVARPVTGEIHKDGDNNLLMAKTGLMVLLGHLCDGLEEIINAISASLPHLFVGQHIIDKSSNVSSLGSKRDQLQAYQERDRHSAFSAAHKQFAQRIKIAISEVKNSSLVATSTIDCEAKSLLISAIKGLLSELQLWLGVLYHNSGVLMKPMENIFRKRQQEAMERDQQSAFMVSSLDLNTQLRNLTSAVCGQLKVFEKCLDTKNDNFHRFMLCDDAIKVLFSILGYRRTNSHSMSGGLEFERFLFSLSITLKDQEGDCANMADRFTANGFPKHFAVPLLHLTTVLERANKNIRGILKSTALSISACNDASAAAMPVAQEDHLYDQYSANLNAYHFNDLYRRSVMELAEAHDQIERLVNKVSKVEGANKQMKKEYISVVDVYESQIRLLSDRLAELSPS